MIVGLCCFVFLLDSFKQMIFQNQHSAFHLIIDTKSSFFLTVWQNRLTAND